jgi:hypothetical protein
VRVLNVCERVDVLNVVLFAGHSVLGYRSVMADSSESNEEADFDEPTDFDQLMSSQCSATTVELVDEEEERTEIRRQVSLLPVVRIERLVFCRSFRASHLSPR